MQFEGHYSAFLAAVFSPSLKAEFVSEFETESEVIRKEEERTWVKTLLTTFE